MPFYFAVRPAAEKLGAGNRSLDPSLMMNYADVMVLADAEDVSQLWEFFLWRRPTRLLYLGGVMQAIETGDATESEVAPHAAELPLLAAPSLVQACI